MKRPGLSESAALLLEAGIENIEQHLLNLGSKLVESLTASGLTFSGSENKKEWSGIYSFSGNRMEELFEHLNKKQIICSLRNGQLRIAPHFYNTEEEINELIDEIRSFYK